MPQLRSSPQSSSEFIFLSSSPGLYRYTQRPDRTERRFAKNEVLFIGGAGFSQHDRGKSVKSLCEGILPQSPESNQS
jgi:hypothetical protein